MKYKIKLITGFRRDQEHSIPAEEAHKAYYLFTHPEARGIFSNGLAIIGSEIKEIAPDYIGTMGWNPTYNLMSDDWNEMNSLGVTTTLLKYLTLGKDAAAQIQNPQDLSIPLPTLIEKKFPQINAPQKRTGEVKSLKDLLPPK